MGWCASTGAPLARKKNAIRINQRNPSPIEGKRNSRFLELFVFQITQVTARRDSEFHLIFDRSARPWSAVERSSSRWTQSMARAWPHSHRKDSRAKCQRTVANRRCPEVAQDFILEPSKTAPRNNLRFSPNGSRNTQAPSCGKNKVDHCVGKLRFASSSRLNAVGVPGKCGRCARAEVRDPIRIGTRRKPPIHRATSHQAAPVL